MNPPMIASQRVKVCPKDGFQLVLDLETARSAVLSGWPAVELWVCRMGHSVRVWPVDERAARRAEMKGSRPCAVCGLWLPRRRGSRRVVHAGACKQFKRRAYARFLRTHPGAPFYVEEQPWYRGILEPRPDPLPPLDPFAGSLGRDWLDGWVAVHGYEPRADAA